MIKENIRKYDLVKIIFNKYKKKKKLTDVEKKKSSFSILSK